MRCRSDFLSQTVATIFPLASTPGNITAHQRPTSRARALTGNTAELQGRLRKLIEIRYSTDKCRETSG
jgi:hypothetical protein